MFYKEHPYVIDIFSNHKEIKGLPITSSTLGKLLSLHKLNYLPHRPFSAAASLQATKRI
jgi:hypothetical protein